MSGRAAKRGRGGAGQGSSSNQRERDDDFVFARLQTQEEIDRYNKVKNCGIVLEKELDHPIRFEFPALSALFERENWNFLLERSGSYDRNILNEFVTTMRLVGDDSGNLEARVAGKRIVVTAKKLNSSLSNIPPPWIEGEDEYTSYRKNREEIDAINDMREALELGEVFTGGKLMARELPTNLRQIHHVMIYRITPSGNSSYLTTFQAYVLYALVCGLSINMGELILVQLKKMLHISEKDCLLFPSTLCRLFLKEGIELPTVEAVPRMTVSDINRVKGRQPVEPANQGNQQRIYEGAPAYFQQFANNVHADFQQFTNSITARFDTLDLDMANLRGRQEVMEEELNRQSNQMRSERDGNERGRGEGSSWGPWS